MKSVHPFRRTYTTHALKTKHTPSDDRIRCGYERLLSSNLLRCSWAISELTELLYSFRYPRSIRMMRIRDLCSNKRLIRDPTDAWFWLAYWSKYSAVFIDVNPIELMDDVKYGLLHIISQYNKILLQWYFIMSSRRRINRHFRMHRGLSTDRLSARYIRTWCAMYRYNYFSCRELIIHW